MRKHVLVLTTTAAILSCGAIAVAQTPGTQQRPTTQPTPSGPMQQQDQTRLQRHAQAGGQEDSDQDDFSRYHRGMTSGGMMGPGMMDGASGTTTGNEGVTLRAP